jgi:hypothetical protein
MKKIILGILALPILIVAIMFLLPRPSFEIEPERPKFWGYPSVKDASYKVEVLNDGKLLIQIKHPVLKGVSPEMLAWWYRYLGSGKVTIEGKLYDFYHLFHLSEHGQTRVVEPSTDGTDGMGVGAIVYRQERFGSFLSKGKGRVLAYGSNGFTVVPVLGPLELGKIEHVFEALPEGTLYTVKTILGSDAPIIGGFLSFYLRAKQFPPELVNEWIRHQVEEVGSLPHFLPKLFEQRNSPITALKLDLK